jgi:glycosyltransferase involved in cell wall biosynthesis
MITVIIPTYSRPGQLQDCLKGLVSQSRKDFKVIVVDDAGKKPALDVTLRFKDALDITTIRIPVNSGAAHARNAGIKTASGQFIAFLDDDAVPDPGWISEGYRYMTKWPQISCIVGRILSMRPENLISLSRQRIYDQRDIHYKDPDVQKGLRSKYGNRHPESCLVADYFSGGNCWFRNIFTEDIVFPESLRWGHDRALADVIISRGMLIAYDPELIIHHDHEYRFFNTARKSFRHAYFSEIGKTDLPVKLSVIKALNPAFSQFLGRPVSTIPPENCSENFTRRTILALLTASYCMGTYLGRKKRINEYRGPV